MKGGRTKFAILSLLRLGPLSGAEIKAYCHSRFGQFWSESYGQIYPTLKMLCEQRQIRKLEGDAVGKSKKYEILKKGRILLREWIESSSSDRIVRDELILKMFSASIADPDILLAEIESALRENQKKLAEIGFGVAALREMNAPSPDAEYWALILRSGELTATARQTWLEEVLAHVKAKTRKGKQI